jgi:hypothetical protein
VTLNDRDLKLLFAKSGRVCARPDCRIPLNAFAFPPDREAILGEIAHIVARSIEGPRGVDPLPVTERDTYDNTLILCTQDHALVDAQPARFTVAVLRGWKDETERWVADQLSRGRPLPRRDLNQVDDQLHSTLLAFETLPQHVYSAACDLKESDVARLVKWPAPQIIVPFIIRGGQLHTFVAPSRSGPFAEVAERLGFQQSPVVEWASDAVRVEWLVTLVYQALGKFMRRKGLLFDRDHKRHYFTPAKAGEPLEITYRSLQGRDVPTSVVWQPRSKKSGEPRNYWLHRAVRIQIVRAQPLSWALALSPDLHVTVDGYQDYYARFVGGKVTRKKARWFNYELLGQVQLWRSFLSESRPRIILPLGGQSIVVGTTLLSTRIQWPGIPEEHAKPFTETEFDDDLWSMGDLAHRDDPIADPLEDESDEDELDEAEGDADEE